MIHAYSLPSVWSTPGPARVISPPDRLFWRKLRKPKKCLATITTNNAFTPHHTGCPRYNPTSSRGASPRDHEERLNHFGTAIRCEKCVSTVDKRRDYSHGVCLGGSTSSGRDTILCCMCQGTSHVLGTSHKFFAHFKILAKRREEWPKMLSRRPKCNFLVAS